MEHDDIIIDGPLLSRAFRRQLRLWVWLGPLVAGLLLLLALCLIPSAYTASVSVAIQQPSVAAGSTLAMLTGGGGAGKTYMGVLKSRREAQAVERHVHLQPLYGKTARQTLDMLMNGIKPEDSPTDGLLYINVTLPGPPRLHLLPVHSPPAAQVKQVVADAANDYALGLKEYYATSDTDQGSVLLRGADDEQRRARADYEDALARLLAFNHRLRGIDPRSAPASSTDPAAASSDISALYASLAQVQGELKANEVIRQTRDALVSKQIQDLPNVPADDELLADIRGRVKQDQADYRTFSGLYGPEYPRVIAAQTRLDVDTAELNRQIAGIRDRLTTPDIRSDAQIQALYKRQAVLEAQIADAGRRLGLRRSLSGDYGRLQTEVQLRLGVLTTTLGEAAKIRLDNASAQKRMTIIDAAIPPQKGEPGLLKLALISLAPVVVLFLAAVTRQYLRDVKTVPPATAMPLIASANGHAQKVITAQDDDAASPSVGAGKR